MLLLGCISIVSEGANVWMNQHEGKQLVAEHETLAGVKLPASAICRLPHPRIIVFIQNKKRGVLK